MKFIQNRKSDIPFSLHDSRIKGIKFKNNTLILKLDRIFEYKEGKENMYPAKVSFTDTDIEQCDVLIFDKAVYIGKFLGKAVGLKKFIKKYSDTEFEIITEGYHGYCTTYAGFIWRKGKTPVSGIINIWNTGDMVYNVKLQQKY